MKRTKLEYRKAARSLTHCRPRLPWRAICQRKAAASIMRSRPAMRQMVELLSAFRGSGQVVCTHHAPAAPLILGWFRKCASDYTLNPSLALRRPRRIVTVGELYEWHRANGTLALFWRMFGIFYEL
jgi:hypothetical protein